MKRARLLTLVLFWTALVAGSLPGYYHFVHYREEAGRLTKVFEKFDLAELTDQTVFFYVSSTAPRTAANDSYEAVISQIRQALSVWDAVPASSLRVAFGGISDTPLRSNGPAGEIIFAELPPGVIGLGGPVTREDADSGEISIVRSQVILSSDLTAGGRPRPSFSEVFFTSLVHEIGHALGLQHTMTSSVMSTGVTRATTRALPLGLDDVAGLSVLYPSESFSIFFGSLSGRVLTAAGVPVHLASVVAVAGGEQVVSTLSDPDGGYRIDGLLPGRYLIYVHPLPAGTQDGLGPANIVLPVDSEGRAIPPSDPFKTIFHGGTNRPSASAAVDVVAGQTAGGIDFHVEPRDGISLYGITTYSFPGNGAAGVHPAFLDVTRPNGFVLATGPGLTSQVSQLRLEILGEDLPVGPPSLYPYDARFLRIPFGSTFFSALTPKHLLFRLSDDIYVLPGAVRFTPRPAPLVHWITPTLSLEGEVLWNVRGENFVARSTVYFDGLPAQTTGFDLPTGEIQVRAPLGPRGQATVVTVYNPDGQSSAFTLPDGNVTVLFPETEDAALQLSPRSGHSGTDIVVRVEGVNTNFAGGETLVGFGTSDIVTREVFVESATRLRVVATIRANAAPGAYMLSVISGLRVVTLPSAFRIEEEAPESGAAKLRFRGLVNSATMRPDLSPGVLATLFAENLPATGEFGETKPVRVTLNGRSCRIIDVSPNQINLRVPAETEIGVAVLEVDNGIGLSQPMLVHIGRVSPGLFGIANEAGMLVGLDSPAAPGETLTLLATGLGVLTPPIPPTGSADEDATGFGSIRIVMAGLRIAPSSVRSSSATPGLDEIRFEMPLLPPTPVSVTLIVEGKRSNPAPLLVQ